MPLRHARAEAFGSARNEYRIQAFNLAFLFLFGTAMLWAAHATAPRPAPAVKLVTAALSAVAPKPVETQVVTPP
ncbi:MAG TPA: hypothetical protein VFV07_10325, partial [Rhizomicrobium sp.]|nr:hypothetical protein [Rhizomicrobium sp.]